MQEFYEGKVRCRIYVVEDTVGSQWWNSSFAAAQYQENCQYFHYQLVVYLQGKAMPRNSIIIMTLN